MLNCVGKCRHANFPPRLRETGYDSIINIIQQDDNNNNNKNNYTTINKNDNTIMTKKQSPTATRLGIRLRQGLIMQRGMVGMAGRRLEMKRKKINQVARKMTDEEWAEMEASRNLVT